MSKIKLTTVAFTGTPELEAKLRADLQPLKTVEGPMIPALQIAQGIYGYLPIEVQKIVAEELDMPLEEVFGVATFYSQFTLNPKGKYEISVCLGTACYVKGSGKVLEACERVVGIPAGSCTSDAKFSIVATRCIGCCGLAPVMTINEHVYGKLVDTEIPGILAQY